MKIKRIIFILLVAFTMLSALSIKINADTEYETIVNASGEVVKYFGSSVPVKIPKTYNERTEEFRGTWVSFYAGDVSTYSTDQNMRGQLLQVLENLEYYHMNAVVFHIRTHNDAMYDTDLAPQSPYTQAADYEKWDYLEWFIAECHKRGIEFHAWLNPYRIYSTGGSLDGIETKYRNYPNNPAHDINNVLINSEGAAILDPGLPEVRQYIIDTVIEIMDKYDVDAIHFDDYFYINDVDDSATRKKYNKSNLSLDNFRRAQVDTFIEDLSDAMFAYNTEHNRCVQLGISPTAVYRNISGYVSKDAYKYDANGTMTYPNGSSTSAWQHYSSSLYCDTKKWVDNEWIDYIVPQAYFALDYAIASFAPVSDWWSGVCKYKKTKLYMGMGLYKTPESGTTGWQINEDEMLLQLRYANDNEYIDGICVYQYRYLPLYKSRQVMKTLVNSYWTTTPKSPVVERYQDYFDENARVDNMQVHQGTGAVTLTFNKVENYTRYAVYRYNDELNLNDLSQMIGYCGEIENGICGIADSEYDKGKYYAVVPLSRANTFGSPNSIEIKDFSPIDVSIGSVDLYVGRVANPSANALIVLNSISQNLGDGVKFKVLGSYNADFSDSFTLIEESDYVASTVLRYKFNQYGMATYIKIVCTNSVGTFESDIYCQSINDDLASISTYIYNQYDDFFDILLGD